MNKWGDFNIDITTLNGFGPSTLQPLNKSLFHWEKEESLKRNLISYKFMTEPINQLNTILDTFYRAHIGVRYRSMKYFIIFGVDGKWISQRKVISLGAVQVRGVIRAGSRGEELLQFPLIPGSTISLDSLQRGMRRTPQKSEFIKEIRIDPCGKSQSHPNPTTPQGNEPCACFPTENVHGMRRNLIDLK